MKFHRGYLRINGFFSFESTYFKKVPSPPQPLLHIPGILFAILLFGSEALFLALHDEFCEGYDGGVGEGILTWFPTWIYRRIFLQSIGILTGISVLPQ
jgi:hypothetical protein